MTSNHGRSRSLTGHYRVLMADRHVCLVCGYGELTESPWLNGSPSDEICPACGTHFGFDDVAGGDPAEREAVYRRRRSEWVANGMVWWSTSRNPPAEWDPGSQLAVVTSD